MKLSIIIPAFNVEKYIEKCLVSTQKQVVDKDDYEVVVIVDGSKDKSLEIAQMVALKYNNIKVFYQENEGLSGARNKGLKIAKGDYVWFIDSDDWIESNCLSWIFDKLDGNLDILQLQRRLTYDDPSKNIELPFISIPGIEEGKVILANYTLPAPAQFRIYRKDFLIANNLWFYKGILHEDSEFMPRAVYLSHSITSLDKVVYNYYQRSSGNIMSSFKIKNVRDLITVNNSLYDFSKNICGKEKLAINRLIGLNTNTIIGGYKMLSVSDKKEAQQLLKENRHLLIRMIRCNKTRYQIEGVLLFVNMSFAIWLYSKLK